jgi:hypothetical protein
LIFAGAVNIAQVLASFLSQCEQPRHNTRMFLGEIPGLA